MCSETLFVVTVSCTFFLSRIQLYSDVDVKVNSVRNTQFELIIFDIKSFLLFFRLKTLIRPTKIILLFPEMRVTKKIFTQAAANLFFNQFFGDILFFSSVSFASIGSCFLIWFVCCFLKLIMYILLHIRLCGRRVIKDILPSRFPETRILFFGLI